MDKDLMSIPIEKLLGAILERQDELFRQDGQPGLLLPLAYKLRTILGALVCVDGIPYRRQSNEIQLMAIRRNTGVYSGKLCFVGGVVAKKERLENALRRHFRNDLGIEIHMPEAPSFVCEYSNAPTDNWLKDPTKDHNVGLVYLVTLSSTDFVFGTTSHGGKEAESIEWFTEKTMPKPEEFGYDMDKGFKKAFELLKR